MRTGLPIAALALVLLAPATAHAATYGAVGGVRDPAAGLLELTVQAVETDGVGLRRATALLGGQVLDSVFFADPDCTADTCPDVATASLRVPTTAVADGTRRLEVTVEDSAGTVTHVADQTIRVDNAPVISTSTVTVSVGAGAKAPQPGGGGPGGGQGSGEKGCRSPRLSMFLASKPLRVRRGRPSLVAGRRYRFAGRLTCVIDGRRRAAPRGTLVNVRDRRKGRTTDRGAARVRAGGALAIKLAHRRSCTVVFSIRGAGGRLMSVRIPVRVVRGKAARR